MASLIERHRGQILDILPCLDRVVIRGTLPSVCHAKAMATVLDSRGIRLFDYATQFAQPFRESIRARAERVAAEEGIEVEYIRKSKGFRKENRIREIVTMLVLSPGPKWSASRTPTGPSFVSHPVVLQGFRSRALRAPLHSLFRP